MITDWNSPQGDFDPTEKQGELLMLLSGQQVTVHTSAEDDFDYMENEDVAFVVKNPHSEEDLLIELCGEFSVFFEKWHGEYPATEEGYAQMTRDVQAVLAGSAGALSLYTEDGWQGTALCTEKPGPDADAAGLLERRKAPQASGEGQPGGAGVLGPGTEPDPDRINRRTAETKNVPVLFGARGRSV